MPNKKLLLELKSWVRSQWERKLAGKPSEWDQMTWASRRSCGTVCCIAGKASILSGWEPLFEKTSFTIVFEKDDHVESADEIAKCALGLSEDQAIHLFRAANTVEQIEELIDKIIDGSYNDVEWQDHLDWDFLADADVRV